MMAFLRCLWACLQAFAGAAGPVALGAVLACVFGLMWAGALGLAAAIVCILALLGAIALIGLIACIVCC